MMDDLLRLGAATLGESGGWPLAPRMRPVWPGATVAAPAYGVVCAAGDNLAVHAAVAEAPAGSVLCVEVEGQQELGWWGEVLTTGAQARGLAGLVIDACVRDVEALERLQFPVFSIGIALPGAQKIGPGSIGGDAVVGEVRISTGDIVVGDRDGVVAITASSLDTVQAAGEARAATEAEYFNQLRAGRTTVELLHLDTSPITRNSSA
ncbi:MAG: 4-hydroxy-4-methyl-2-oxoglutarate aldolase [Acidimicrobiaceae bacterium]|jgi:4-hydroxy-4-methyl-2-oxoglutarate aldolase